jgi:quaternary ammonium compound-resistance protein SugE
MIGGLFETAWAVTMKYSDGFSDIFWTVATLGLLGCSIYMLNGGIRRGLPVGGGYSVWVGVGAIGSIVMGILLFSESVLITRLFFAALIIMGIIGVELTCGPSEENGDQQIVNGDM